MDMLFNKILIVACMVCSMISVPSIYKGEERLSTAQKQEIEAYMNEFVSMFMSEAVIEERKISVKSGEIDTDDLDSPIGLTVYTDEEGEDIRYTVSVYGETGNSVTDYYVCEDFIYVNQEQQYYSGQVLIENYNDVDVLYRHTSDWIILGDKVYLVQDNGELLEDAQYPFFTVEDVSGWVEEMAKIPYNSRNSAEYRGKAKPELETYHENTVLGEAELQNMMEEGAGHEMESTLYIDMDHDGDNELIGVYFDEGNLCQAWYCSSDGRTCMSVYQGSNPMDTCMIEKLDMGDEVHIVLNTGHLWGIWKTYSIFALEDNQIRCLLADKYGYVKMTDEGDIVLNVEAYDGVFKTDFGMSTHTWKDTYLFYDGNTYKEYGAAEITEEDYLSYQNAQMVKDIIDREVRKADTTSLRYSYYIRRNGIMHIQCEVHNSDEIQYGYYTVRYEDNVLDGDPGEYNPGQMGTSFSDLEVVY